MAGRVLGLAEHEFRDFDTCPHCKAFVYHSQVTRQDRHSLHLKCDVCDHEQEWAKDANFKSRLSRSHGVPVAVQPITAIDDLSSGDVIGYQRVVTARCHPHHAIVVETDKASGLVTLIEFVPHFPLRKGRVGMCQRDLELDIVEQSGWVMRFMPLDCHSVSMVLEVAYKFVDARAKPPKNFGWKRNSQHLVSFCKSTTETDLEALVPPSFYQCLKTRRELIREFPAVLHTDITPPEPGRVGGWLVPLPELEQCLCGAPFYRSSLVTANESVLELKCCACEEQYILANIASQRDKLMSQYGEFSEEKVPSPDAVSVGDILVFKNAFYEHHAVLSKRFGATISRIEYFKQRGNLAKFVRVTTRKFEKIVEDRPLFVKRFLPLDCLPPTSVLSKAEQFLTCQPPYSLDNLNCQHMSTFCKTGQMCQKERYLTTVDDEAKGPVQDLLSLPKKSE